MKQQNQRLKDNKVERKEIFFLNCIQRKIFLLFYCTYCVNVKTKRKIRKNRSFLANAYFVCYHKFNQLEKIG